MALRPKVSLLDQETIELILEEATEILETLGVFIENEDAISLLAEQGIQPDSDRRIKIPRDLVQKSLSTCKSEYDLFDREGNKAVTIGGDNVCYDPGSAAINILDNGEIRSPTTTDYIKFAHLVENLDNIKAQSTAFIPADVPKEMQDWWRLFLSLLYCRKPIVTGTFRKESFSVMLDLLVAVRGSREELHNKPLAIFDACPSPPLRWSDLTCQSVIDAARVGVPSTFISMPIAGANGPATLLGSITQHTAETLSGVVISQLASPGAPVNWGGSPAIMDMRTSTAVISAIETVMTDMAYVEVGKSLGFPTHAYMGLSDSKILDGQAGLETTTGAILAALSGVNIVSGLGMLDFESCQSLEKLVIDDDIAGIAYRLIDGIETREKPFALEILRDFDDKGHLLTHPSTLKWFRKERFFPSVLNREPRESWKRKKETIETRAQNRVETLLSKKAEVLPDDGIKDRLFEISEKNAKNLGLYPLPNIMT